MKNNASIAYSICLVVGDFVALLAAFAVAYILRVSLDHTPVSDHIQALTYIGALATLLPFFILVFALLGLYDAHIHERRFSEFGRLLAGNFIGLLAVISYTYLANVQIFPARLVVLYGLVLAFCFTLLLRTLARGVRRTLFNFGVGIERVLIVGDTVLTQALIDALRDTAATGYRVVGVVGCAKYPLDKKLHIKCFDNFNEAIDKLGPELHTIVQTELFPDVAKNDEVLVYAQEHHLNYRFVPGNSESFVGNIEAELFHSIPVIAVHQTALTGWGRVVKRITDVVLSLVAIVLASPIMLVAAVAIKLTDGGPVFFRQARLTRGDRQFRVFKFRSENLTYSGLTPEAAFAKMGKPELAIVYRQNGDKIANDPRKTPFGRFMLKTSIDELPQLFNVFLGDISLVGPRALIPQELAVYKKRHVILSVKSGITGLAQVSGRRTISFDERRRLDLYYVQNWSFWSDLIIMIRTAWIVLLRKDTE